MAHCYLMILFMDSELGSIKKLGEGTYGEAYRAGRTVCKVVPFDGDLLVNGESQKVYFILQCYLVCICLVLMRWFCFVEIRRNT